MNDPQPKPNPNGEPDIGALVVKDMQLRVAFGLHKYGTPLQPFNGRDGLKDLYQELLDACAYTRQLIYERDGQ